MYSVTLEVTDEEYTWRVLKDGELYARHTMVREKGGARGIEKYTIFENAMNKECLQDVLEAIEDGDPFEIMRALEDANGDWEETEEDWELDDEEDEDDAEADSDD